MDGRSKWIIVGTLVLGSYVFVSTAKKIWKKLNKSKKNNKSFPAFSIPTIRENSPLLKTIHIMKKDVMIKGTWLQFGTVDYIIEGSNQHRTWELVERITRTSGSEIDRVDIIGIVHSRQNQQRQLALIVSYRPAVGKFVLELPGGLTKKGETCEDAAFRELREEAGLQGEFKSISPELMNDPWKSNENSKIIQAQIDGDNDINCRPQQQLAQDEMIELIYFPIDNLLENLTAFCDKFNTGIDVKLYTLALGLELGKNV